MTSPTFALFCTIDGPCFLFAEVADEIEAVRAFRDHVRIYNRGHEPYIHMEPMRAEWSCFVYVARDDLDPVRNLFRPPAEVAS